MPFTPCQPVPVPVCCIRCYRLQLCVVWTLQPPAGSACSHPRKHCQGAGGNLQTHPRVACYVLKNSLQRWQCPGFLCFFVPHVTLALLFSANVSMEIQTESIFSTGADSSCCEVSVNQVCRPNCGSSGAQNPLSQDSRSNWTQTGRGQCNKCKTVLFQAA